MLHFSHRLTDKFRNAVDFPPLWALTVPRFQRKLPPRVSPETSAVRRPRPLRNETAEQLIAPSDSTPIISIIIIIIIIIMDGSVAEWLACRTPAQ